MFLSFTSVYVCRNEGPIAVGRLGVEATFDTWKSSLQWPIARTPSLLLTVVVFLGGGDARGGDLLLPTFGKVVGRLIRIDSEIVLRFITSNSCVWFRSRIENFGMFR